MFLCQTYSLQSSSDNLKGVGDRSRDHATHNSGIETI